MPNEKLAYNEDDFLIVDVDEFVDSDELILEFVE